MSAEPRVGRIAFIDFEASGLGAKSWPIEVGWAFGDGGVESWLIQPHKDWPMNAWDSSAQSLHGLTPERLEAEGADPEVISRRMNEALGGLPVYSDAPDWDGFWLFRLFEAAGVKPAFMLKDFGRMMRTIVKGREDRLRLRADRIAPRGHRAAPDALHLQTLYSLACED